MNIFNYFYRSILKENFIETEFTPEQIQQMKDWIADCSWRDLDPEDLANLSDEEVIRGINKHYEGGISAFLRAG